ncbi:MAG: SIS domain-containing protein [Chloroflexaceae bacterium]|nr:SIS domain-containing protein [Chloroflexaceae bacterium]
MNFSSQLNELVAVLHAFAPQAEAVERVVTLVADGLLAGHTLFTCGNGGSATDAMHLAEELVGRYRGNRRPLPAVSLNADPTALTCIANDFGFEQVFARQLKALARPGDMLVVFSTSGNSPNILRALEAARNAGVVCIALLGKDGGPALALADYAIVVPSQNSARIQEVHTLLLHAMCEAVEQQVAQDQTGDG